MVKGGRQPPDLAVKRGYMTAIEIHQKKNRSIAVLRPEEGSIGSAQDALDMMMQVQYKTGCKAMVIPADAFAPAFFDLKSRLAGDILQKAVNYTIQLVIWGDYAQYPSRALATFITESNRDRAVFYAAEEP